MKNLEVQVASGDELDVRQFSVGEAVSSLFGISLIVLSRNANIDFDAVVGKPAKFTVAKDATGERRSWDGICNHIRQLQAEESGGSTYELTLVPVMWLLTQRRNYRMFQQMTEPDIAMKILREWGLEPINKLQTKYKTRKYKVQYAESDYDFVKRILEECGVTFTFEAVADEPGGSGANAELRVALSDAPETSERRKLPLAYAESPNPTAPHAVGHYATHVLIDQVVRPGKYTMRDHDYRKRPEYKLLATATNGLDVEERLEQYHYTPGAFLFGSDEGEDNPAADDKGKTRVDEKEAARLAARRLAAERATVKRVNFVTNALDVAPGSVLSFAGHPRTDLGEEKGLLVLSTRFSGGSDDAWDVRCEAVSADQPYHPPVETPKPTISGVESATCVGPAGEEIHTDEFGRIRVHFHWDRESKMNDDSSCWIHVSQGWGGSSFGATMLPRVGQEVLVDFIGGDPDRPIVTGRVYTNLQKTPYNLPANKTQSGFKTNSTGGGGGYNELMFEDKAGSELVRMRAERDRHSHVNNNCATHVGANRSTKVGANESKHVKKDQDVKVGGKRTVSVSGPQTTTVGGPLTVQALSSQSISTRGNFACETVEGGQQFSSKAGFFMQTDGSFALQTPEKGPTATIMITPDAIIIDAPKVLINPGPAFMAAVRSGRSIDEAMDNPTVMTHEEYIAKTRKMAQAYIDKMVASAPPEKQDALRKVLEQELDRNMRRQWDGKSTVGVSDSPDPIVGEDGLIGNTFRTSYAGEQGSTFHDLQAAYVRQMYDHQPGYSSAQIDHAVNTSAVALETAGVPTNDGNFGARMAAREWTRQGLPVPEPDVETPSYPSTPWPPIGTNPNPYPYPSPKP